MAPGGSDGALAGGAGERDNHAYTAIYPAVFRSFIYGWPDFFARPMLNLLGYLGAFVVVAGAMYSAIGHRIWGGLRKHETVVSQPRSGE